MADPQAIVPLPTHAYVPGRNSRHADDCFAAIKGTVSPNMSPEALSRSPAFRAGLRYLDKGYFWECHEVLEAVWLALPDGTPERHLVQAIIQLANARLKLRMDRPKASVRLCDIVDGHLDALGRANPVLKVDITAFKERVHRTRQTALNEI